MRRKLSKFLALVHVHIFVGIYRENLVRVDGNKNGTSVSLQESVLSTHIQDNKHKFLHSYGEGPCCAEETIHEDH